MFNIRAPVLRDLTTAFFQPTAGPGTTRTRKFRILLLTRSCQRAKFFRLKKNRISVTRTPMFGLGNARVGCTGKNRPGTLNRKRGRQPYNHFPLRI